MIAAGSISSEKAGPTNEFTAITEETPSIDTTPTSADDKRKQEISLTKKVQSYYTRILLFAFITKDTVISLTDIIAKMETDENGRIAKNLGLSKNILILLNQKTNKFVLSDLDYKIQDLNNLSRATDLAPAERANVAVNKFGKLGDAIVITPSKICDDMVNLLPEEFIKSLPTTNGKVLDIAGTAGEFAVALHKRMTELGLEKDFVANAIYTIPKSSICYELTRKLYEMLELNVQNIAKEFIATDMLDVKIGEEIDYDKIKALLTQNKPFNTIKLTDTLTEGETEMLKFEAVVGNPPYQEQINNARKPPVYHLFYNVAYSLSKNAVLISPARFLFNAGQTPKAWNKKMLSDEHIRVAQYFNNANDVFNDVEIKGGVAIIQKTPQKNLSAIGIFSNNDQVATILNKVLHADTFVSFKTIVYPKSSFNLTEQLYVDYPKLKKQMSKGNEYIIDADIFNKMPEIFTDEPFVNTDCVCIRGKQVDRIYKYIKATYIKDCELLNKYKVFIPGVNGSGKFGETLSSPEIGSPKMCHTQTFMSIGLFDSNVEAENCIKYLKSKFLRLLLSTLKVTHNNPRGTWTNIPLQDFTANLDIDWTKSIPEIDQQLYKKYNLTEEEISFIESMIKPME